MLSLQPSKLLETTLPVSTAWLLSACAEARGKQDLWTRQKPEVLKALREQAIVQSVESSNRIEGVTIAANRLRPIVLERARPGDRPEEELAGYRRALSWIFARKQSVPIEPAVILHLHALAQDGLTGDAGKWKNRDNEIVEILPNGERRIRFRPTPAAKVAEMVRTLCRNYQESCEEERIPRLMVLATFVFDLLCIHPFRDGNGRVSRLVTTLLLQNEGFHVGKYVSLERLVEDTKDDYYRVLAECSDGWTEGENPILPWWNYFLGMLRRAYVEFGRSMESAEGRPAKSDLVRRVILAQVDTFTLGDLAIQSPTASPQLIKKVLAQLKGSREIRLSGRGRGARWKVIRKPARRP